MLELSITTAGEARRAAEAGAARIVISGSPVTGGLTPAPGIISYVKSILDIPVAAVLRPHAKTFVYDNDDNEVLLEDATALRKAGADYIIFGALTETETIDLLLLEAVLDKIKNVPLIFSQAVDLCQDLPWQIRRLSQYEQIEHVISRGGRSIYPDVPELQAMQKAALVESVAKERKAISIIAAISSLENIKDLMQDNTLRWAHLDLSVFSGEEQYRTVDLEQVKTAVKLFTE